MEKESYEFHRDAQDIHWWFKGRSRIIERCLEYIDDHNGKRSILDIGSGFGAVIPVLSKYGTVDVIEPLEDAYPILRSRGAAKVHSDIKDFPESYPDRTYDIVTMFDVLEHIEDDMHTLQVIGDKVLAKKGYLILTVPAYNWLWSIHDDNSNHFRRYTKRNLLKKIEGADLIPVKSNYFMTLLFPVAMLQRLYLKVKPSIQNDLTIPPRLINSIFTSIFSLESRVIDKIPFLFGLSILIVCRKNG